MKSTYPPLLIVLLVFSGCATDPISTGSASAVPIERILAPEIFKQKMNTALVMVKRDTGYVGSFCPLRLLVDGHPVADLRTGEIVSLYIPLGDHIIGAHGVGIMCQGGLTELAIFARSEKPVTLRIRFDPNGAYTIQPTAM